MEESSSSYKSCFADSETSTEYLSAESSFGVVAPSYAEGLAGKHWCEAAPNASRRDEIKDEWMIIGKFLDGKVLAKFELVCKWVSETLRLDRVWKNALLRDLKVADPGVEVSYTWKELYAKSFDSSHSYEYRQQDLDMHLDWVRVGAMVIDSDAALVTEKLVAPIQIPTEENTQQMVELHGCCVAKPIQCGIWLADLHLVRCPCANNMCDGRMFIFDARNIELFLSPGYTNGTWEYDLLGSRQVMNEEVDGVTAAIFDIKYLEESSTRRIIDLNSWKAAEDVLYPKSRVAPHAMAGHANVPRQIAGREVKYYAMRAGKGGNIVAIRISQKLL